MSQSLIIIKDSWHKAVRLFERLGSANEGDTILLIRDAVLSLNSPITLGSFIAKCEAKNICVVALKEDCQLRGIENRYPQIQLISYADFVELVATHSRQVSW